MGNTIEHTIRPIRYSPFAYDELRVSVTKQIKFLEDPSKQGEPFPKNMFADWEKEKIQRDGRLAFSEWLRSFIANYMKD